MKFGTDGIRGRCPADIGPELAMRVGNAVASWAGEGARVAVGRDGRRTGVMLEAAVVAGITAAGGTAVRCGVLPTPGLSVATAERADAGIMITASHNPPGDDGLKALGRGGRKIDAAARETIERALGGPMHTAAVPGGVEDAADAGDRWVAAVVAAARGPGVDPRFLSGHTIVLDTANGAASGLAGRALVALGARVLALGDGDGSRINVGCGALHPETVVAAVRARGASAGIALDGDGDRVVLVDAGGNLLDGDALIWLLAEGEVAVGTIMSNEGLARALAKRGQRLVRTKVGDAYVADGMVVHGARMGAEPSGHVLFDDGLPTGCGLLAALRALRAGPDTLAARLAGYAPTHQAHATAPLGPTDALAPILARLEGEGCRVVVRPSGTEPVVRLMVEHADAAAAAAGLDALRAALGYIAAPPESRA